ILGNEVATLVNDEMTAGSYEVEFSASGGNTFGLSSGIYFYSLSAEGFHETRKMILLK
ncbi:MAG: peptidase S8, partial [Ignavibacteriae bacterium]